MGIGTFLGDQETRIFSFLHVNMELDASIQEPERCPFLDFLSLELSTVMSVPHPLSENCY